MRRRGGRWGRLGWSWGRHATAGAAVVALVCAIVLSPGSAHATSDTVIGFDNLTRGTVVTTQYQTAGVELGHAADFGKPSPGNGDCGAPTVETGAVPAYSSPNYAVLATCGGYAGTFGKLLDYPRGRVSVEVINLQGSGPAATVTLTAYDDAGNVVATASGSAGSAWAQLIATQPAGSGTPRITSFAITASTSAAGAVPSVAIDNLAFDQAGAPLSATGIPISATAGSPFSGPVATITDGDPTAVASDFTATITWGDGASSAGTVSSDGSGTFTVSGSHTWQAAGSYPVHVAVTKVNGRTAGADLVATVTTSGGGGGGGGGAEQAVLSLLTPNPVAGGVVTFSGAGSRPGSGTIISYDWDFNGDGRTDTSTGTNPIAHFIFPPGMHTVGLTTTNSQGQHSYTQLTLTVTKQSIAPATDAGGQGPCQSTYDNGNVHIVADCIQTTSGGGYVIQTRVLDLNGMMLVPKVGTYGTFHIAQANQLGIGSGLQLSGVPVNIELFNTPIGDMTIGGIDLTANPAWLTFTPFVPPKVLQFSAKSGPRASAADSSSKGTLLMSLGVGKNCTQGNKDPECCPPSGPTSSCATLPGGFPITGQVNVYLNSKGQVLIDVQVGLDLQAVNFEATGALEIQVDLQHGVNLDSLQFTIPQAGLADIFTVKDASFVYYFPSDPDMSKRDSWQAKGTIIFGPMQQPSLQAELDFKHGQFQKASMLFTAPSGTGVPIYPGILVNQIGATVGVNPFEFGGTLGASIATQLELSLSFLYQEATDTQFGFFGGQGTLTFQGDKIASLAADVYSDGYVDAALDIDLHFPFDSSDPVVQVTGHIGFWDEPSSGRWEADGSVALKVWIINGEVAGLVNNEYIAGCADINGWGVQGRYRFADGNVDGGFFGFSNCSDQLKQYKETPVNPHSGGFVNSVRDARRQVGLTAADTRGGGTITLPGGTAGQELRITTAGAGTPQVTIYTPDHKQYTTPAAPGQVVTAGSSLIAAVSPDGHQVLVLLRHPPAGTYNIQPTATSPAIVSVAAAQDAPPANITVAVRHPRGRQWTLAYRIRNYVPGTRVQFVARGRDSAQVFGTVQNARGVIHFVPRDAIARHRTILAYLRTAAGTPLRTIGVGSFTAPPAIRPGPVARLRFTRGGGTATLSWGAARAARRYFAVVRGSDGRVVSAFMPAGQRRLTLPGVLPFERFTARVVAEGGPNMLPGPARGATLAALGTGSVELLRCKAGRCRGAVVAGTLVTAGGEVLATAARGGRTLATGIANALHRPSAVSLTVRRKLAPGRYTLTLTYRRGGRVHRTRETITIT